MSVYELEPYMIVAIGALVVGVVFGATVQLTNFCTMGGISDYVLMGEGNRFRAWLLAAAVAIIGSQALQSLGYVDLDESIYLTPNLGWLGAILGGFLFGFGMTKAAGCGSKNLARLGAGSLKSLVTVLVIGVVGYMTLRGLIGPLRLQLETTNLALDGMGISTQHMGDILASASGIDGATLRMAVAVIASLVLLWLCFKSASFRSSPRNIAAGIILGLCVPAGWYVTGVIGADDFEPTPLASMTFISPTADSLQYLMTWTGSTVNFGIASVGGVILGSFLAAIATRRFRVEGFASTADTLANIGGAALMGFGGVLALGCTIGQGLTGMSTLATGSLIAWLSIMAGGYFGIKHLEEGTFTGALRASFSRA